MTILVSKGLINSSKIKYSNIYAKIWHCPNSLWFLELLKYHCIKIFCPSYRNNRLVYQGCKECINLNNCDPYTTYGNVKTICDQCSDCCKYGVEVVVILIWKGIKHKPIINWRYMRCQEETRFVFHINVNESQRSMYNRSNRFDFIFITSANKDLME